MNARLLSKQLGLSGAFVLVLMVNACVQNIHAQVTPGVVVSPHDPSVGDAQQMTIGGNTVGAAVQSAGLAITPGTPIPQYVLPSANRAELSTNEIAATLEDLFKWGPAKNRYASYFTLLPALVKTKEDVSSSVLGAPLGTLVTYQPYSLADKSVGVKVQINTAVYNQPMFQGNGASDAIFVRLDAFGNAFVPIPVADVVESNFLNGLVTRLILGHLSRLQQLPATGIDFASIGNAVPQIPDEYNKAGSYSVSAGTFEKATGDLLRDYPVQPMALFLGWKAGEELDALTGQNLDFRNDVWKLLIHRFSTAQLGEMTAYTLNYLVGYASCQRIQALAANNANPPARNTDIPSIFASLSQDEGVNASKALLSGFHRTLVGEFYALTQNNKISASAKEVLLSNDAEFLNGFEAGTIAAADQIFRDVFQLAYGLGYKDGFRDGFAQGYATGWRD